nr:retrovirus-related Pol polyprotein from transposon TNT 1-94 [Tanacetum cinerariifolium]
IVDNAWIKHSKDQFRAPTAQDMEILIQTCLMPLAIKTQNDSFLFIHELKQEMHADLKYVESLEKEIDELESDKAEFSNKSTQTRAQQSPQTVRNNNPYVSTSQGVNHKTNVSKPQQRSNQLKDKVLPNNSQVKLKKTQVEEHPRIPSIANKMKSVTACNDSLNSRTLNANVVCATCKKCFVDSDQFACITKMLNEVNARTKKPNVVPISTRKPKGHANKSIVTPHKKKNVQLILFIVDSGCTKHMTGNLKLLCNFVKKFLGTVCFGNDQFAPILGYEDLVQGNITINRVYYVEGLNHNLFLVGQFCDADLEVAFRKSTCFVRDLQGNDLLTGNRESDLYTISLQESTSSTRLCLMSKASLAQTWLWHRRLYHLNFDYINLLSKKDVVIGLPKAKRSSFKSEVVLSSKGRLNLLHMDLCGPMRVASINGKKYILVIVDDYSIYTWTLFLRSKDETPEVLKEFLTVIQRNLQAPVITVRIDRDKMKEKGDLCILVGYSTQSKGYRVYNKRTKLIVESIHIRFDEIKEVYETYVANDTSCLIPQRQKESDYDNSDPVDQLQNVSSSADAHVPSQQELDLLFDKQPTTNIQPSSVPSTPSYVHVEENNDFRSRNSLTNHLAKRL